MQKKTIAILAPYIQALRPNWVVLSIVAAFLTGVVLKMLGRRNILAVSFTILYLCLVYTSTVLSRMPGVGAKVSLIPLWSYTQWIQGRDVFLKYIVLNIMMLLPIGVSLSFVWESRRRIVYFGFLFSSIIEVSQLISGRGLFEIDDILHNTLGVALGILIYTAIRRLKYEYLSHRRKGHGGNCPLCKPEEHPGRQEPHPSQHPN